MTTKHGKKSKAKKATKKSAPMTAYRETLWIDFAMLYTDDIFSKTFNIHYARAGTFLQELGNLEPNSRQIPDTKLLDLLKIASRKGELTLESACQVIRNWKMKQQQEDRDPATHVRGELGYNQNKISGATYNGSPMISSVNRK